MSHSNEKSFLRVSWLEIAVAAVLTTILVAVILLQFAARSRAAGTETKRSPAEDRRSKQTGVQDPAAKGSTPITAGDPWTQASLDDAIDYDPFTPSAVFQEDAQQETPVTAAAALADEEEERIARMEAARAARAAALSRLSQQGFNAFLAGGEDGNVAVLGTRPVQVGDIVDGFRVVAVEPNGVVVEPFEPLEAPGSDSP